jgi:hypothetical protein
MGSMTLGVSELVCANALKLTVSAVANRNLLFKVSPS